MIRGSSSWLGLNMDWDSSVTAGWKKGGHFACGAGGTAMLVYPPTGGNPRPGDSIHAFPAQRLCDGDREGGGRRQAATGRSERAEPCAVFCYTPCWLWMQVQVGCSALSTPRCGIARE